MSSVKIEFLPEHLIDQIKAGEVVERPANVLKEIMENALDAGASKLDIEIIENGMELIRVTDNGSGISSDQIEMAFGRHATSKIKAFQDLYSLSTFGFRGEALPSIASISHIECVSWTQDSPEGVSLRISGAMVESKHSVNKTSLENGTIMSVRNLFYNTPARLKFLQSAQSEKNWIKKYFYSFVVSRPHVEFSISWDQNEKIFYPKVSSVSERILQLFSSKAKVEVISNRKEWNGIECEVFFIFAQNQRSDGPLQHILINGRPVLEKSYQRITQQVLEKVNLASSPDTLIMLKVPGDIVDVNVHPNKTVVKFFRTNDILSLVSATLADAISPLSTPSHPSSTTSTSFEWELPQERKVELKDRSLIYSEHRDQIAESAQISNQPILSIIHQSFGPYFLINDPQYEHPFYICGKSLLLDWIQDQRCATPYPLLVSHPLKNIMLKDPELQMLREKGFEIDKIKDLFVIREIPSWAVSLPLNLVISSMMTILNMKSLEPFSYQEIATPLWIKMYQETQSLDDKSYKVSLNPKQFFL